MTVAVDKFGDDKKRICLSCAEQQKLKMAEDHIATFSDNVECDFCKTITNDVTDLTDYTLKIE